MLKFIIELDDHKITLSDWVLYNIKNDLTPILGDVVTVHRKQNVITYKYEYAIPADVDMDDIASIIYSHLDMDFVLEIDADVEITEPECSNDEEHFETLPSLHCKWVDSQMKDGWRYGIDYLPESKTNPYLVPYHQLTKRQKKNMVVYGGVYGMIGHDHNDVTDFGDGGGE